jgi:hypothetical protein
MISIQASYHVLNKTWDFVSTETTFLDNEIKISIVSDTEQTDITGIEFGYTVTKGTDVISEKNYPQMGTNYELTDASPLVSNTLILAYEQAYSLNTWVDFQDTKKEQSFKFEIKKPVSPHAGWVWDGIKWSAPMPAPEDGKYYNWNESSQTWQVATVAWADDYKQ